MGADWPTAPLDELVDDILDRRGVTPLKLGSDFVTAGHRVISAKLIKGRRIDLSADDPRFVDGPTYKKWMKTPLLEDDVIMTSEAPLGELAYVAERLEWCLGQRLFGIRSCKERLHGRFLYYALQSGPVTRDLHSRSTGTTVLGVRQTELRRIQIPVPPLRAQRAIAHILGTLDDKIDLNRRMNDTLEAMARALFKSWFVDFDPVRAKAEGRQPSGMDAETAKLFPSEFVESELGEIPKGWTCSPLGDWASALSGGTPSKSNPSLWGGDLPWVSPKVMTSMHADEADDFVTASAVGNGTRIAPLGSTLVMVRGMGLHQEVRVSQARREVTFNQDVKALVPKAIEASLLLFALLNGQEELLGRVESSGHGTGKLPSEILLGHRITLPPISRQKPLAQTFDALNDRIGAARQEARTLAKTRDTLLPQLLSGELDISTIECFAGAVA